MTDQTKRRAKAAWAKPDPLLRVPRRDPTTVWEHAFIAGAEYEAAHVGSTAADDEIVKRVRMLLMYSDSILSTLLRAFDFGDDPRGCVERRLAEIRSDDNEMVIAALVQWSRNFDALLAEEQAPKLVLVKDDDP